MNEIEQMFYDAWEEELRNDDNELCTEHRIVSQFVIGIYKADFVVDEEFVIEIDGFEYHTTKEQREKDYKRERYLMRHGFRVIRFTGTEIYLSSNKCAAEALKLIDDCVMKKDIESFSACVDYHERMLVREAQSNGA